MIASPSAAVRLGVLVLLTVVLQISGVVGIDLFGSHADLVPLMVAAVGFYAGSVSGATAGFLSGVLLDLALGQSMGASSLVLTLVGYGVGRVREVRDPAHGLVVIPVAAAASAAYGLGFAAVSFMLGLDAPVSVLVLREILVTSLVNAALALPVFWIIRRGLRPVLTIDPLGRGRFSRQRAGGGLGLRGLEV